MKSPALEGDLAWFQPAEVLQLLQLAQATGLLAIERSVERVELVFERGQLIAARTSGAAVRVGEVLVHRGVVIPEAVELALSVQQDQPGERIGQMLISAGAATQEQITDAMREVVRRVVYGLLLWREGRFHFTPGPAAAASDLRLDLDLDRLILEGLRLADQRRAS